MRHVSRSMLLLSVLYQPALFENSVKSAQLFLRDLMTDRHDRTCITQRCNFLDCIGLIKNIPIFKLFLALSVAKHNYPTTSFFQLSFYSPSDQKSALSLEIRRDVNIVNLVTEVGLHRASSSPSVNDQVNHKHDLALILSDCSSASSSLCCFFVCVSWLETIPDEFMTGLRRIS